VWYDREVDAFDRARRMLVASAGVMALGLAIAGSIDRTAGGAIVVGAWVLAIASLHRLGRAGSARRD
jgi:hypothetical protein